MDFFIDTHAHVYADDFQNDRMDMLQKATEAGVGKVYMPNVDHASIDKMMEIESRSNGQCIAAMGLHPCSVKKDFQRELYIVEEWLAKRKFAAVGEIGTDLYWDKTFWEQQKEAFTIQVNWAKQYKLPIIIHCRESIDQTIELVEQLKDENLTGIFHCFSGNVDQAYRITRLGFMLGIGGVATFKNGGLDKVLPQIELDHLVLETDSPYLAPVPHRGKRNEPSYVPLVAQRIADIMNVSVDEVQRKTTHNALKIFV
ncbi:TatD family hydrolase [Pseudochryseolinea flava]|uniref:Hydrolase TatD n=1 Tax=Pseudochryseolinea flava TaxID=2059302 RepID=A0A364Y5H3_9BACT|nr:TatD family hydrolase [Pseudochryseolinea flava]RAW01611.1 hydrolase TatD [Pseudochryseolinea flava]